MNKVLAALGITTLLVGFALLVLPVSRIPLLDANRQVLAESNRAGYCAGQVYVTSKGMGSEAEMADCQADSNLSDEIDHLAVQPAFCAGIIAKGLPISPSECTDILSVRQLWPTATGTLTASWNRRFPYPGDILSPASPASDQSRTGEREENEREESLR